MEELKKQILEKKLSGIVEFNKKLKEYSTIKIGGRAFAVITPTSEKEFIRAIKLLRKLNLSFKIIGAGSNVLFPSVDTFLCFIVTTKLTGIKIDLKKQTLTAFAGERLSSCFLVASNSGLSGFEELFSIPATVGGSIVNNAGAFGKEISENLESAKILQKNGKIKEILRGNMDFSYRSSGFKTSGDIILSATFKLKLLAPSVIKSKAKVFQSMRIESQPTGLSLGSVFKKVNGVSAGKIIDDAGFKGLKVGGCFVSTKHANFILNDGTGTEKDFKKLVSTLQKQVKQKYNIDLEKEVEYVEN